MALLSTDGVIFQSSSPNLIQTNNILQLSFPNYQDRVIRLPMYVSLADGSFGGSTGGEIEQPSEGSNVPYQVWS